MIHVSVPQLVGREFEYVRDAFSKNEFSWRGAYVERFENAFAAYCHCAHGLATSSGTSALHLSLLALGIGPGDDVILPDVTYVAVANAVRYVGANPVFVDVDPVTWNIDPYWVEIAVKTCKRPRAVVAVHLFGLPCDMIALKEICKTYDMYLVEDACEAHGATYYGEPVGSLSDIACFSFFANKLIATGEGGMCTTQSAVLFERMYKLRGQGQPRDAQFYHDVVGYNYRLTNVQAAMGLGQLETLPRRLSRHRKVAEEYRKLLKYGTLQGVVPGCESSNWMVTVLLPAGLRDVVRKRLSDFNVETRPVFTPCSMLPMYEGETGKVSQMLYERGVSLPTHTLLTQEQIHMICGIVLRETAQ